MTADRVLELLRELRCLETMAHHIATFPCRRDTRATWTAVATAIDDRKALIVGVLQLLDVDFDTLAASEEDTSTLPQVGPHTPVPRCTIH